MKKFRIEAIGIDGEIKSVVRSVGINFLANDDTYIDSFDEYMSVELLGMCEHVITCDGMFKITRTR